MGKLLLNNINYTGHGGGGGNADYIEITQAEYDRLPMSEKKNGKMYFITDGEGGGESGSSIKFTEEAIPEIPQREIPYYPSGVYSGLTTSDKHVIGAINEVSSNKQDKLMHGTLASGTDLDNVKTTGFYWVPSTGVTNTPVTNAYFVLEVIQAAGATWIQRCTRYGANATAYQHEVYTRMWTNSQWYAWTKIGSNVSGLLTANNCTLNSYKLVKSGNIVNVFGTLSPTSGAQAWVNAFTLPSGFIPSVAGNIQTWNGNVSTAGLINVRTDGGCQYVHQSRFTVGDTIYFSGTWSVG